MRIKDGIIKAVRFVIDKLFGKYFKTVPVTKIVNLDPKTIDNKYHTATINIAKHFSTTPFGRTGPHGGEVFRAKYLVKTIGYGPKTIIDFDGLNRAISSAFLEEAFGGLARELQLPYEELRSRMVLKSDEDPSIIEEVEDYLKANCPNTTNNVVGVGVTSMFFLHEIYTKEDIDNNPLQLGREFREKYLEAPISNGCHVTIDFSKFKTINVDFLFEAIGTLIVKYKLSFIEINQLLTVYANHEDSFIPEQLNRIFNTHCKQ